MHQGRRDRRQPEDIPANQRLDPLVERGVFVEVQLPLDWIVDGAVTDLKELEGTTTTTVILANEQIPVARLSTETMSIPAL